MAAHVKIVFYSVLWWAGFVPLHCAGAMPGIRPEGKPAVQRRGKTNCETCTETMGDSTWLLPKPGAALNYNQIMFEHPQVPGATGYVVEVFEDNGGIKHIKPVIKRWSASPAVMLSNFEFGKKYIWRYACLPKARRQARLPKGRPGTWRGPYRFEIMRNPYSDEQTFRVHVVQSAPGHFEGLVSLDMPGYIINDTGKIVWFLPPDAGAGANFLPFQGASDLRFTPSGTLTMINRDSAEERDLNGKIIWMAPLHTTGKAPIDRSFNHCFAKLQNGHYMTQSHEKFPFQPADSLSKAEASKQDPGVLLVSDDVIDEFDAEGKLVWKFSSKAYHDSACFADIVNGKLDMYWLNDQHSGHLNGFWADEQNGYVYASFRNDDLVVKMDKSTQKVVHSWLGNTGSAGSHLFSRQHCPVLLHDGSLALYSNNTSRDETRNEGPPPVSDVVIFSPPAGDSRSSKVIFRLNCRFDTASWVSLRGGSVVELPNGHLLICMGAASRIFETDRNKNIFWNALVEQRNADNPDWMPVSLYKSCYTSSLYPCYFAIQTRYTASKGKGGVPQLLVFNSGSEADSYRVTISSDSTGYYKQFQTQMVPAGTSVNFELLPGATLLPGAKISLAVTSVTNPAFGRVLCVQ